MNHFKILSILITTLLIGCSLSPIKQASETYKQERDHASLEAIFKYLYEGMPRNKVEGLLGEPVYSPINGQYYYSSDRRAYSEDQDRDVPVGLVVDFRDSDGELTSSLQEYWLGPIAE